MLNLRYQISLLVVHHLVLSLKSSEGYLGAILNRCLFVGGNHTPKLILEVIVDIVIARHHLALKCHLDPVVVDDVSHLLCPL